MGRNRLCAWREGACGDVCARVHAFFFFFFFLSLWGQLNLGHFPTRNSFSPREDWLWPYAHQRHILPGENSRASWWPKGC